MISRRLLDSFYRKETNANIKERILLVKRVRYDKQEAASAAETELGKTRTWAYKWLHRFDKDGLGLKDKKRTGRPPDVTKDVMVKIRQVLIVLPALHNNLIFILSLNSSNRKYAQLLKC